MSQASPPAARISTDEIVTGEGARLEAAAVSTGVRVLSAAIDYGLYGLGLVMSLVTWAITAVDTSDLSRSAVIASLAVITAAWTVLVPLAVEGASHGRSAGRLVTGTVVVRDDGAAVRLRDSAVRVGLGLVEVWACAGVVALVTSVLSPRSKRLGDVLAGTHVVATGHGAAWAPPLLMPDELAAWATGADLGHLDDTLALACRTFLQRASSMEPASRRRLGQELAATASEAVYPPPPQGTHPERFLAAILCERRDRDLERLRQREDATARLTRRAVILPYGLGRLDGLCAGPEPGSPRSPADERLSPAG